MKSFGVFAAILALFAAATTFASRQIQFKPWVRSGQENEYKEFIERQKAINEVRHEKSSEKGQKETGVGPKFFCDKLTFDFGRMTPGASSQYTFQIKNNGDSDLHISSGGSSCMCTQSDVGTSTIAPGSSHDVTLSWFTRAGDKAFNQYAKLLTNDPDQPEVQLTVIGQVETLVAITPGEIYVDNLEPDSFVEKTFTIYSSVWDRVTVDRIDLTDIAASVEPCDMRAISPDLGRVKGTSSYLLKTSKSGRSIARVYVRPDEAWMKDCSEASKEMKLESDGTILIELPVAIHEMRRLGLYSPWIRDADKKVVDLKKHFVDKTGDLEFVILARIRGDQRPEAMNVSLDGIPGLKTRVEPTANGRDYRVILYTDEPLAPVIRDTFNPATLRIDAQGVEGGNVEFKVFIDVLKKNA